MFSQFNFLIYLTPWEIFLIILDITVVSFVIYKAIMLIKGTRAVQLIKGLFVLIIAFFISDLLQLTTVNWFLQQIQLLIVVALPIVFQPELRRALEQLGRGKIFSGSMTYLGVEDRSRLINELVRSVQALSKNKFGALIVIENETGLSDFIETGVNVDGAVSAELLVNIFVPNTPLHDGAVIVRGDRIAAAGCFLPLTDSPYLSKQLGTRHRAALGVTETSDCVVIVVSEETGTISVAHDGELTRYLEEKNLKEMLEDVLLTKQNNNTSVFNIFRRSS
ncbi:diadenylate cyclase CdaA [Desulfitibacter alkalitolerans]|uniref:diadenylate cyclase CdaA n=1 Tax=Desulfitibacter alkalitolerans TaxID=264641 RepID=UPI000AAA3815|nr:diadenylate cyclase CdaA [Desulfitibacter alkalitolerans]